MENGEGLTRYITREGLANTIRNALNLGGTTDELVERILEFETDYRNQFIYTCNDTWCPLRIRGRNKGPGFPTKEALEHHRLHDHTRHGLERINYSVIGSPWFTCMCGYVARLESDEFDRYEESGFVPRAWPEHMKQVEAIHGP